MTFPSARLPVWKHVVLQRDSRLLTIVMNRPDRLNAFDALLHKELPQALSFAAEDPDSDVVILTGAGRGFSAGGDLAWQQAAADEPRLFEKTVREAKQIVYGILDCEKPIIARVNGPAVGLGATIALLCDIIIAARSAYFSDPHVNVGMVAGDGGALIWPQLIGYARAKEFLFTGDRIAASDALAMGLINRVAEDAELAQTVTDFAKRLLAQPQLALRYSKLTINAGLRAIAPAILDIGLGYESVTSASAEHREALAALREKRAPVYAARRDDM